VGPVGEPVAETLLAAGELLHLLLEPEQGCPQDLGFTGR